MKKKKDQEKDIIKDKKRFSFKHALEPRILFDATLGAVQHVVEALTTPADTSHTSTESHADTPHVNESQPVAPKVTDAVNPINLNEFNAYKDTSKDLNKSLTTVEKASDLKKSNADLIHSDSNLKSAPLSGDHSATKAPTELLFVDSSMTGVQQLIRNVRSNVEVILLDPNRDGFSQISESLANHNNLSGISLITRGESGNTAVGSSLLTEQSLNTHAFEIASWQSSLAKGADFSIYGSELDHGTLGKDILSEFSSLIKTPINISNNLTDSGLLKDINFKDSQVDHLGIGTDQTQKDHNLALDNSKDQQSLDQQNVDLDHTLDQLSVSDLSTATDSDIREMMGFGVSIDSVVHDPAITINPVEGVSVSNIIYITTDLGDDRTYSLSGNDASEFSIDSSGNLRFVSVPDFETKNSYDITIETYHSDILHSTTDVRVNVADLPPVFVSPTAAYVLDGTPDSTIVYTAMAFDPAEGLVHYSITGADANFFTINSVTGALSLNSVASLADKASYNVYIKASDESGAYTLQPVTIQVTSTPTPNPENLVYSSTNDVILLDPTIAWPENTPTSTVIYTAADQTAGRTYSLVGADAGSFTINASGQIKFKNVPNFESGKISYVFTIDTFVGGNLHSTEDMVVNIDNLPPNITSGNSPTAHSVTFAEGVSAGTTVYDAAATDPAGGTVTFSMVGADSAAFSINVSTGKILFIGSPDYETQSTYTFDLRASDPSGAFSAQTITVNITDVAPVISSGGTASIAEGTSISTIAYQTVASDIAGGVLTYTLLGTDAASFTVDSTGAVRFVNVPDRDTKASYSIQVKASDPNGLFDTKNVTINVTNVAPVFPPNSGTANIDEGVPANTVVYTAQATDPGGGVLTYTIAGGDANSFNIGASTGIVTIKASPNFEVKSTYNFNVVAKDANNATTTQAVVLTINNSTPVFSSGTTANINEGGSANPIVYTAAAADPVDPGVITYVITQNDTISPTDPGNAFSINTNTGAVTFNGTPNFEDKSIYTFTIQANDTLGVPSTRTVTFTVNDVAPTITSGASASVAENTSTGTVIYTATATDPAGGTLTYSLSGTDASAFSINSSTGAINFNAVPDFESKSTYNFNVNASDGTLITAKAVTVNITDLPPNITSASTVNINEGLAANTPVYNAIATDPAGGAVTYSISGGDFASFNINSSTGVVTFANNFVPDFEAKTSYSFTVKAEDASGAFNTQVVTINVNDLPPNITSATSVNVNEGIAANTPVYTAIAADPGGGNVTYSISGGDFASFNINSSTGVVTFANNFVPDFETKTSYSFTVKAEDPNGLFNTQAVTININDLPPNITSATTVSVNENLPANTTVYTAIASDPAGGTVTYSLTGTDAASFSINASSGAVVFANNFVPDFESKSSYSFTVKAQDASGAFSTQGVTVNINDLPPNITSATSVSVNEGLAANTPVYTAIAADPAGGTVTYSLTGGDSANFSINSSTGVVTFANNFVPDFETKSSYNFTVKAEDPSGAFNTQGVTININDLPPNITSATSVSVNEGLTANTPVYTAIAADPAGGTVTYSLTGADAASFSIDAGTGIVTFANNFVPDFETKPSYNFTVKAEDASGAFNTQAVTLDINNLPPDITSATNVSVNEGLAANTPIYTAVATDPAGGVVTYSLTGGDASNFNIDAETGVVTFANGFVPDFETKSSYSFDVKASDASGIFNTQTITVSINDLPPNITSATSVSVNEGLAANTPVYTAIAADPAGGTVSYSLTGVDASSFSINSSTGVVTFANSFVPDFETKSSYSFDVKAEDASGAFSTQAVTLTVNDLPPVISSASSVNINEGLAANSTIYTAIAADPGGGSVTYSLTGTDALSFNIDASTGVVTFANNFVPDFDIQASYSFDVKASDQSGEFTSQTVTVTVNDVVTGSTLINIDEGLPANTTIYTAPLGGSGLTTYSLFGTDAASFNINSSTGVVTFANNYVPDFETKANYNFNVKTTFIIGGAFTTEPVTVSISDLPPDIISEANVSVNEGLPANSTVYTAIASDPAGGTVTYSLSGTDAASFNINTDTGVVTFANNFVPDFETKPSYSFDVKAEDPSGAFTTQTVTLTINDLPPTINNLITSVNFNEGLAANTTIYTAQATDPGGGTITYSLVGTDAGSFNINSSTGVVTFANNFVPDYEYKSSYTFDVKAQVGNGEFSTKTITVTINDLPPEITSATNVSVNEGLAANTPIYTAIAADPAGGTVTYSLAGTDALSFSIDSGTGVVIFANNAVPDYETKSSYSFDVIASDASGVFSTQTVTVAINNLPPEITSATDVSINEGLAANSTVYTAIAADPGGGTITYSIVGTDASSFNIDSGTGVVTFANDFIPDFETKTSYSFDVRARGPLGNITTQTVNVTINNLPPDITSATNVSVNEGLSTSTPVYTAIAADPAGGSVTYSLAGPDAASFNINSSTGVVKFNFVPDFETKTSYSFELNASDDSGTISTQTVTLTINDLPPTISSGSSVSINEGLAANTPIYTAIAADPAGGNVTYSLTGTDAASFNIDSGTGIVTFANNYVPDFETQSSYSFDVKAEDASGAFTTQTVIVDINNLPPDITSASTVSVNEGLAPNTPVYTATATEPGGASVTYSLTGADAGNFNIDSGTGVVTFANNLVPDFETKSSYSFDVKVSDATSAFTTQTVTLTVNDLPPDITSASTVNVNEGLAPNTPVYTAIAADPAGGIITYSLTGADAASFTIDSGTGVVTFASNFIPNFETKSSYSFDVKAEDASGASTTQTVNVAINDLPPTISSSSSININEGLAANTPIYTAIAADPAGGAITYSLEGADAANFNINSSTGVVTFANNVVPDFETQSSYSFDVKAEDASGAFNTQTVTLTVHNLPPNITSPSSFSINETSPTYVPIYMATANDPGGGAVTYSLAGADASEFYINPNTGEVILNGVPNFATKPAYHFDIVAKDASGMSSVQAVTLNVIGPTSTPVDNKSAETGTTTEASKAAEITSAKQGVAANNATINAASENAQSSFNTSTVLAASDHNTAIDSTTINAETDKSSNILGPDLTGEGSNVLYNVKEAFNSIYVFEGSIYNVAVKGTYGTLHFNTETGQYVYQRNDIALHPRVSGVSERFVVTISSGNERINLLFTVNASNLGNKPMLETTILPSLHYTKMPSDVFTLTQAMSGQVVVGAVLYKPSDAVIPDESSKNMAKSLAQIHNERFNANVTDLLKDFGLQ